MKNPYTQFAAWGRIGGRLGQRLLAKAKKRKDLLKPTKKKRGRKPGGKNIFLGFPVITDRDKEVSRMFIEDKKSYTEIGKVLGVSRERVRQLLKKQGVTGKDGGKYAAMTSIKIEREIKKKKKLSEKREVQCFKYLGCSIATYENLTGDVYPKAFVHARRNYSSPVGAYLSQLYSAGNRKIKWEITFPEWWGIWTESGKWRLRGRGQDKYVMGRYGDTDGYKIGNVEIILATENNSDRIGKKNGLPIGVLKKGKRFSAFKMFARKQHYLGTFDTPEQAHEAYLNFKPNE